MPCAFHLEHADRLAARQQLEGRRVVERQRGEVDRRRPRRRISSTALSQHGQGLQAQEVELDQARLLDPLHVELGDRQRRARVAVERHQLVSGRSPMTMPAAWVEAWR